MGVLEIDKFGDWNRKDKSIVERARGLFHRPRKPSLKENLSLTIYRLETTSHRLKSLSEGLKRRNQKFFEKCIEAEIAGNNARATLYANECAEIRKLASLVISSELALEQAALRLQTISKLGDVMNTIAPIIEIVEETKGRLGNIIPSVSSNLNEINDALRNSLTEMGSVGVQKNAQDSSEAMNILKEANLTAEKEIRERFPRLPKDLETPEEPSESRIPVALTATGGNLNEAEELLMYKVYEYIKACNGELNPMECASILGVPPSDIERAVLKLKEEGRITIE